MVQAKQISTGFRGINSVYFGDVSDIGTISEPAAVKRSAKRRANRNSRRADIYLPPYYQKWVRDQKKSRGWSRSAAIRNAIDAHIAAAPSANEKSRADARAIQQNAIKLSRLIGAQGKVAELLAEIEAAAGRIAGA